MEENNIDTLFQEKLTDLEIAPNESVWNAIEGKLQKKKKRKVFPIWWFSGGAAAVFILGLFLYSNMNESKNTEDVEVIVVESPTPTSEDKKNKQQELKDNVVIESAKENTIETIIAKEELKNKKTVKEKPLKKDVLSPYDVVKVSEKEMPVKKDHNTIGKVIEGALLAKNDVTKEEEQAGKLKNSLPVITREEALLKRKKDTVNQGLKPSEDFMATVNKEEFDEKQRQRKVWTISPTVAVLNSSSFSKASPIEASLSNSTKGETSYSYGVQVAYQFNSKWTLQSGIHLQEMGYSNHNVAVNPVNSSSANVAFSSGESFELSDASELNFGPDFISLDLGSLDGILSQTYGYIEVPIEVKYNLLEVKKLKTEIVVGFSSLFLNKNEVNLSTTYFSNTGEANNLNKINFSGNFGVDFNYQITKKWSLNVNPMLKTQLNTFKNDANGFQPYFIGFYTGINYQF
ncbi:outer membrane beta-barrel protein [Tenacibaculum tangerinum]|uniref:Outer membrane beta-barrel protein n=1 Tax=Tenacibaculum tangerinum TaxID=3038772 RepID=A0ABY8KZD4_9FLAO|nr:outer membrane beta-barrel protein [Tenacibaculum tangerinum]WGH74592.1 outer membrane beta-barrel protein [Tenacibaculum tangerinum]